MPKQPPGVIVLCGGTSRRLAGLDKTRESLAGTTVMDHLLDSLPSGWEVVCVGEQRPTTRPVSWCREAPAGGGPVAGIAAGLDHLDHLGQPGAETCVVVAGDMPFASPAIPALLDMLDARPELGAVVATDPDGRRQPLLAAYRCGMLRAALPHEPAGARLLSVVEKLTMGTLSCAAQVTHDVDTPDALERARHIVGT